MRAVSLSRTIATLLLVLAGGTIALAVWTPNRRDSEIGAPPCPVGSGCPLMALHEHPLSLTPEAVEFAETQFVDYLSSVPPSTLKFYQTEIEHFEIIRQLFLLPMLDGTLTPKSDRLHQSLRRLNLLIQAAYLRSLPVPALATAISVGSLDLSSVATPGSRAVLAALRFSEDMEPTAVYLLPQRKHAVNRAKILSVLNESCRDAPFCYIAAAMVCVTSVDSCLAVERRHLLVDNANLLAADSLFTLAGLRVISEIQGAGPNGAEASDALFLGGDIWIDNNAEALNSPARRLVFNYLNNRVATLTLVIATYRRHGLASGRWRSPSVPLRDRRFQRLFDSLALLARKEDRQIPRQVRLFGLITCAEFAEATSQFHHDMAEMIVTDGARKETLSTVATHYDSLATSLLRDLARTLREGVPLSHRDRVCWYLAHSEILAPRLSPNPKKALERLLEE